MIICSYYQSDISIRVWRLDILCSDHSLAHRCLDTSRHVELCLECFADLSFEGKWYRASSRQVRRLQAILPGPINAIYGETVAGTTVIRAFGAQSVFIDGRYLEERNICSGSF